MDPDKAHEQYFKKNPQGNHMKMSDQTARALEAFRRDFNRHTQDDIHEFSKISDNLTEIKVNLAELTGMIKANSVTLSNVHEQTIKTNGRVNTLEKKREEDNKKRDDKDSEIMTTINKWKGGIAVALVLLSAFWSFITFVYPYIESNKDQTITLDE